MNPWKNIGPSQEGSHRTTQTRKQRKRQTVPVYRLLHSLAITNYLI